ncbi:MAG: glycosyltransferase [Chloroflexota bacterium]
MTKQKILILGASFLYPYWKLQTETVWMDPFIGPPDIDAHPDAAFAYFGTVAKGPELLGPLLECRDRCKKMGIPTVWHTIEDPNSFTTFVDQAAGYDIIATSDCELIPDYENLYPDAQVIWLPNAAQPAVHRPLPLVDDPADFVLLANFYQGDARKSAETEMLAPLVDAGYSLSLHAFEGWRWPEKYDKYYRGPSNYATAADFYPEGRVALGMNNQAWNTGMCSMRTFEVLACGKPMLSYHSDSYEKLGFVNAMPDLSVDGHFVWVDNAEDALIAGRNLLSKPGRAAEIAERGRAFVLKEHTYANRLETVLNHTDQVVRA